jgi:hypothetical protein
MVFLGPAFHEVMTRQTDPTWIIRACEIEPGGGMSAAIDYTEPTTVLLDLGTPVDEELYTQDKIMSEMLGAENWQKLLPSYLANLKRRHGS